MEEVRVVQPVPATKPYQFKSEHYKFDDAKKAELFKLLATKSQVDAAIEMGVDKFRKTKSSMQHFSSMVKSEVAADPKYWEEKYGITPDIIEMVRRSSIERKSTSNSPKHLAHIFEQKLDAGDKTIKELVEDGSKKSLRILNMKLEEMLESRRAYGGESVLTMAKVAGILFDKRQLSKGEATEHII